MIADVDESRVAIENRNQIGEARHHASGEALFLLQALFHLAALGNVSQRSLQTHRSPGSIAHGKSGREAMDLRSVLAAHQYFAIVHCAFYLELADDCVSSGRVNIHVPEIDSLQLFFVVVPEYSDQGGIRIEQLPSGGYEKDSLAEGFKQFLKADFGFLLFGNVARPSDDGPDLSIHSGLKPAIEIAERLVLLEPHRNRAGPHAVPY